MTIALPPFSVRAVLLDIEGTTAPVSFVYEVLFPYARSEVKSYLKRNFKKPETRMTLKILQENYEEESSLQVPSWTGGASPEKEIQEIVNYVEWLMEQDRKSTGLKLLQGFLWEAGYKQGKLRGKIFPDVPPALSRWKADGIKIFSFSSGSVLAQQLFYSYSEAGNLTSFFSRFFDTMTGKKNSPESYEKIAGMMETAPSKVLFVSDVISELDAAKASGMQVLLSIRPGNQRVESSSYPAVRSFEEISVHAS